MTGTQLEEQPEVAADDGLEETEDAQASSFSMLELVGDANQVIVHERRLKVDGKPVVFHIKQLSIKECTELDAKKYTVGKRGQIERDLAAEETNSIPWILHRCVVKNSGTAEAPNWTPLWSLDDIKGRPPQFDGRGNITRQYPGLLGNPSRSAQDMVNALTLACWEVNPPLNPMRQVQALSKLGIG